MAPLAATLLLEFPDRSGDSLPGPLMNLLLSEGGRSQGRRISMSIRPQTDQAAAACRLPRCAAICVSAI
jgi:hypothetical protein